MNIRREGVRVQTGKRGAAVLLLAAVLSLLCGCSVDMPMARGVPLRIEVIVPQQQEPAVQAAAAAAEAEEKPRVLIYHTHTWEAYEMTEDERYTPTETWRTKDERHNMIRVGEVLADHLRALGFDVTHDRTAFEPPNLSQSYARSLSMLEERMDGGERYDYIFDVHRDAYSGPYNGANGISLDGRQAAYVMMLVGKGTGATGSGFDERPDWPQNLALAQAITDEMNSLAAGISREVKIKTGRFNQHVSTGALLIEVGNNRNTLAEALAACPVIAQAVAGVHFGRASDELAHM